VTNGTVALTNTILFSLAGQTNVAGVVTDGGHNMCSDASAGFTSPSSRMNLEPLLGPLSDNGGATPAMPLLPASLAIDAGDDSACPPTDQRGVPRPQGFGCDIGAFELIPMLLLSSGQLGKVRVDYQFQASRTNAFSASTNLTDWLSLGLRVSDTNGLFQIEEVDPAQLPIRFYRVQRPPGL
jgi:hypothetical protein